MIAENIRDPSGELRFCDFNSFLKVNRALCDFLNPVLYRSAATHRSVSASVFTHLIKTDNLARLKMFLELGADVETFLPDLNGIDLFYAHGSELPNPSPLLAAASLDNVPLARLLLEHGANPVQYSSYDVTRPCYSAIHAAQSSEMVQLLLDHHADINQKAGTQSFSFRPLHYYAGRSTISVMRLALENGAETDPIGIDWKPLHCAAMGSIDAVKLLLQYGADEEASDTTGDRPAHVAAEYGLTDIVTLLLARKPEAMWWRNRAGYLPLHTAASAGKVEVVRFLFGLSPAAKRALTNEGQTPWMLFAEKAMHEVNAATTKEMLALLLLADGPRSRSICRMM
jgi:ankyrin repeat protein